VFNSVSCKFGYSFMKNDGVMGLSVTELMHLIPIESFDIDCESTIYFVPFEMIFLSFDNNGPLKTVDDCYKIVDSSVLFVCKCKLHYQFTTVANLERWQGNVSMLVQLDSTYLGVLLPVAFLLGSSCIVNNELLTMRSSYSGWVFVMYDLLVRHNIVGACMVERDCVVTVIGRSTMSFDSFPGLFQPTDAVFDKNFFATSHFRREILRQIDQDHYDTTNLVRLLKFHDKKRKFVKL
jgi:hypothetical protein